MRYRVTHRPTYSYDDDVRDSSAWPTCGRARCHGSRSRSHGVADRPGAGRPARDDTDCYGNVVSYFQVTEPHRELTIDAASEVSIVPSHATTRTRSPSRGSGRGRSSTRRSRRAPGRADRVRAGVPAGASTSTRRREYAAASLTAGRPIGEAVTDLMHRIHARLRLRPDRDDGDQHGRRRAREAGRRLPGLRALRAGLPAQPRASPPAT